MGLVPDDRILTAQPMFWTAGIVMSLYALWMENEKPSRFAIEKALQGNLCRCTGYFGILRAVHSAAAKLGASGRA